MAAPAGIETSGPRSIEWIEPQFVGDVTLVDVDRVGGPRSSPTGPGPRRQALIARRQATGSRYRSWRSEYMGGPAPRQASRVARVVHAGFDQTFRAMKGWLGEGRPGPLVAVPDLRFDPAGMTFRAPGRLHVPWAYPDLPVWVAVEPWWRDQSVVSVRLRTTRRWRYPIRYFRTAHAVLDQFVAAADTRGSSSAGWRAHQPHR